MKKVLVTGDRGYIGSVLVPLLLKNNFIVRGFDNNYFTDFLPLDYKIETYEKITKDIRMVTKEDLVDIDAIVHLAALSNDPLGELDSQLTFDINYKASIKLAKLAKQSGVKRFIFFSSCSVYGGSGNKPVTEKDVVDPLTAYAQSKVLTEKALMKLADKNFTPVLLRNATVYGYASKLRLDLAINNLVAWALTTGKITLLSNGKAWRPFIHIQDIATVCLEMLTASKQDVHNQIFNVGSNNQNHLIYAIAEEIKKQLPQCEIIFKGNKSSDSRNYKVDFNKLAKTFPQLQFKMDITKGIAELIDVMKQYNISTEDFESKKYIRINSIKYLLRSQKIDQHLFWKVEKQYATISGMIDGVFVKQLKKIPDERGVILHMLRCDDKDFKKFGEIYFSKAYPGVIKGWHIHKKMTLNYCVIEGMVKLVLYDNRKKSKTYKQLMELFIGEDNYCLVTIPPGVVNGYKTIGINPSILANCATLPHDPKEIERMDPFTDEISYSWDIVMK